MMQFAGEFRVAGKPEHVIQLLADVERVSRCVPGATLDGRDADGAYVGTMVVALGPKRVKFHGRVTCEVDLEKKTGKVIGRGRGDVRGTHADIRTEYQLHEELNATSKVPRTVIRLNSTAKLQGILAEFAQPAVNAIGVALIEEFGKNLELELAGNGERTATSPLSLNRAFGSSIKNWILGVLSSIYSRVANGLKNLRGA